MHGLALKIERLRRGLSQWDLSRLTDIPPYRISSIERDRIKPSPKEAERIERALKAVHEIHS